MGFEYECDLGTGDREQAWQAVSNAVYKIKEVLVRRDHGVALSLVYKENSPAANSPGWNEDIYLELSEERLYLVFNGGTDAQIQLFLHKLASAVREADLEFECEEI